MYSGCYFYAFFPQALKNGRTMWYATDWGKDRLGAGRRKYEE
nr:MAG TPA: Endonuclease VIII-like protein [Caudoviricetes sp.]DAI71638.1 MAG TPA: endonuclease VIII-like oriteub [Caudoviricetes sp.]DAY65910.1 MAG TPA: hypothetical protein [Caudoviricetes sp.]